MKKAQMPLRKEPIKKEGIYSSLGDQGLQQFSRSMEGREIQFLKILCFLISENLIFLLIVLKWMYKEESLINGGVR